MTTILWILAALIVIGALGGKQPKKGNRKQPTKKANKISDGYKVPKFNYTETTIVKIKDATAYSDCYPRSENYTQEYFDQDIEPDLLEIEVAEFEVMFKKRATTILNIDPLPRGLPDFHQTLICNRQYGNKEDIEPQLIDNTTTKQLLKRKLISAQEVERTDKNITTHLNSLLVAELKEKCEKLGLKKNQNKTALINSLMTVKDKISLPPLAIPTQEYYDLIETLGNAYIEDVTTQLIDKPKAYAGAVWQFMRMDCIEFLPDSCQTTIMENAEKYDQFT